MSTQKFESEFTLGSFEFFEDEVLVVIYRGQKFVVRYPDCFEDFEDGKKLVNYLDNGSVKNFYDVRLDGKIHPEARWFEIDSNNQLKEYKFTFQKPKFYSLKNLFSFGIYGRWTRRYKDELEEWHSQDIKSSIFELWKSGSKLDGVSDDDWEALSVLRDHGISQLGGASGINTILELCPDQKSISDLKVLIDDCQSITTEERFALQPLKESEILKWGTLAMQRICKLFPNLDSISEIEKFVKFFENISSADLEVLQFLKERGISRLGGKLGMETIFNLLKKMDSIEKIKDLVDEYRDITLEEKSILIILKKRGISKLGGTFGMEIIYELCESLGSIEKIKDLVDEYRNISDSQRQILQLLSDVAEDQDLISQKIVASLEDWKKDKKIVLNDNVIQSGKQLEDRCNEILKQYFGQSGNYSRSPNRPGDFTIPFESNDRYYKSKLIVSLECKSTEYQKLPKLKLDLGEDALENFKKSLRTAGQQLSKIKSHLKIIVSSLPNELIPEEEVKKHWNDTKSIVISEDFLMPALRIMEQLFKAFIEHELETFLEFQIKAEEHTFMKNIVYISQSKRQKNSPRSCFEEFFIYWRKIKKSINSVSKAEKFIDHFVQKFMLPMQECISEYGNIDEFYDVDVEEEDEESEDEQEIKMISGSESSEEEDGNPSEDQDN